MDSRLVGRVIRLIDADPAVRVVAGTCVHRIRWKAPPDEHDPGRYRPKNALHM